MKYKGNQYAKYKKLSRSLSNMNRLCYDLERWDKDIRFKRTYEDFDYKIMIDNSISMDNEMFNSIEEIFLEFCKEMRELAIDQNKLHHYDDYIDEFGDDISREEALLFTVNWNYYYDIYRKRCLLVCGGNEKILANIAVKLCYEKYPRKNKKFLWRVAGNGVVDNIKQAPIMLPLRDDDGNCTYLGKKYSMVDPQDLELEEFFID